jgi:hypothetical protein
MPTEWGTGESGKSLPLAVMDLNPLSEFLVVDDYGTGGIWFVVRAANEDDIRAVLPKVVIYPSSSPPEWMSEEKLADIATRRTYDLDRLPDSPWMTDLKRGR